MSHWVSWAQGGEAQLEGLEGAPCTLWGVLQVGEAMKGKEGVQEESWSELGDAWWEQVDRPGLMKRSWAAES